MKSNRRWLFLDCDGVLNNSTFMRAKSMSGPATPFPIDPVCLARLHTLLEIAKPQVILSSSWRIISDGREVVIEALKPFRLAGTTPCLMGNDVTRGDEIQSFLARARAEGDRFVILDDDADMHFNQLPFLVQTSFDTGLTDRHVVQAIELFQQEG